MVRLISAICILGLLSTGTFAQSENIAPNTEEIPTGSLGAFAQLFVDEVLFPKELRGEPSMYAGILGGLILYVKLYRRRRNGKEGGFDETHIEGSGNVLAGTEPQPSLASPLQSPH